ncbi:hypothetical protein AAFN60_10570 [Roseibacillus persicicus]|uniref:hypothetical protein n=1 Tax=Roseibacillus persicicus TaxID=454148 RepID=UPI00398A57F2
MDEKDSNSFLPSTILNRGASGVEEEVLEAARECGLQVVLADSLPGESNEDSVARMVSDSDATLVIIPKTLLKLEKHSPLTARALKACKTSDKPSLILTHKGSDPEALLHKLRLWLIRYQPQTLFITGPTRKEAPDAANFSSYLFRRTTGQLSEPSKSPLLVFTCILIIVAIIGNAILEKVFLGDVRLDLFWTIFVISSAFAIWRGSLVALRFSSIYWGLATLVSAGNTAYLLFRGIPYQAAGQRSFFPPDEKEFWLGLVLPVVISAGVVALLSLIHQKRRIQLWTRNVRFWTTAVALWQAWGLFHVVSELSHKSESTLNASQRSDYQLIKEHFSQYGTKREREQEEELTSKLAENGNVIRITVTTPSQENWTLHHRQLLPQVKESAIITHYSNGETKTEVLDHKNRSLWNGDTRTGFIRTQSGDWLSLEIEIGTYTPRE